jgi:hypothetical protein
VDDKIITGAAEAAIEDLQLDCRVEGVRHLSGDVEWCVEFSGKYGPLRDDFKNQFDKENSSKVVREKIKRHLLEQVTKIRSNTGKTKRPRSMSKGKRDHGPGSESSYKFIDEAFDRAAKLAGQVVERVSGVAGAARAVVSEIAEKLPPVTIEVQTVAPSTRKRSTRAAKPKAAAARKAPTARKKASKSATSKSGAKSKRAAKKGKEVARRR